MATLTCHTPPDTPRHTPPGIQLVDPHIAAATQPSIFEGFDVSYDATRALLYAGWHSPESVINRITHLFHKSSGLSFYGRTFVQIIALDGYESRKTPEQIKEIAGWSDAELSKGKRDAEKQGFIKDCRTHGRGGKQNIKYHWLMLINGMMRIDAAKFPEESRQIPFSTNRRNASYSNAGPTDSLVDQDLHTNRNADAENPFSTNRRKGNFHPPQPPQPLPGWIRPLTEVGEYTLTELQEIAASVAREFSYPLEESDLAYAAGQVARKIASGEVVAYAERLLVSIAKNRPRYKQRAAAAAGNSGDRNRYLKRGGRLAADDAQKHRDAYARRMAQMAAAEGGDGDGEA